MSTETKTPRFLQPGAFTKVVATVFSVSCSTAVMMAVLRLLQPQLFYVGELFGTNLFCHYLLSGLMVGTSCIGIVSSGIVLYRNPENNQGSPLTMWLLLQSFFEISRICYLFTCAVYIKGKGVLHLYDLIFGVLQYVVDSYFYCQIIVKN